MFTVDMKALNCNELTMKLNLAGRGIVALTQIGQVKEQG
jgi:hypothetical protein